MNIRESQYVDRYLDTNAARGPGNGLTVGTFLNYTLRGRAKRFSPGYHRALWAALNRRIARGEACLGRSAGKRTAVYRNPNHHQPNQ